MLILSACGNAPQPSATTNDSSPIGEPWFVDRAAESGLTLRHVNGMSGKCHCAELIAHAEGARTVRFTDLTQASGIDASGYGMGAATGDFDNNGCVDLYLTSLGPNALFQNNCDGTFTNVSSRSGTAGAQ